MKRGVLLWTSFAVLTGPITALAAGTPLVPLHAGYAFDTPRVLVQQRLFGLAHGIASLAAACAADTRHREAAAETYAAWNTQQADTVKICTQELAQYYFGNRAAEAARRDVARALKLHDHLALSPDELSRACETLAETLQKPRYDLRKQFRLQWLAARLQAAGAIESEADACRTLLPETGTAIDAAMAQWRARYDNGIAVAQQELEQYWPESQMDVTLPEWLDQARARGRRKATLARCSVMVEKLQTPEADPDDTFRDKRHATDTARP